MRLAGLRRFFHGWVFVGVFNVLQIAFCIGGIAVAHAARLRGALAELGLHARFSRAAAFSFIAALPMLLVFALTSPINLKISFLSVGVGCFLAPFAEEMLFRGYMFGQLYRRGTLGFLAIGAHSLGAFCTRTCLPGQWCVGTRGDLCRDGPWKFARVLAVSALERESLDCVWSALSDEPVVGGLRRRRDPLGDWIANGARFLTVALAILLTVTRIESGNRKRANLTG